MLVACEPVELELPAEPGSIRTARRRVREIADACGADAHAVALCVSEAVTNAIVHGYREGRAGIVRIRATPGHDGAALRVDVEDDGVGMAPRADSPGAGLGLPLIASMAARLDIDAGESGTRVSFWFAG